MLVNIDGVVMGPVQLRILFKHSVSAHQQADTLHHHGPMRAPDTTAHSTPGLRRTGLARARCRPGVPEAWGRSGLAERGKPGAVGGACGGELLM